VLHAPHVRFDFIALTKLDEEYKLWSLLSYDSVHWPISSSLSRQQIQFYVSKHRHITYISFKFNSNRTCPDPELQNECLQKPQEEVKLVDYCVIVIMFVVEDHLLQ
jgi:hypothetical protein